MNIPIRAPAFPARQVLEVKGNTLVLGGADIVDGSPILDIKPYVPFCDGVASATAPAWVAVSVHVATPFHTLICYFHTFVVWSIC